MIKNVIRDQISTYTVSKNGYVPVLDAIRGAVSIITKDEAYQKWMYEGGANSVLMDFDFKNISTDLSKLNKETGFVDSTFNLVRNAKEALHLVGALGENATRVGEFRKALAAGKTEKQAAFEARDLLDFAKVGAKGRAVNQVMAFWNVGIQGRVRLAESFRDDPAGTAQRIAISTVIPTALLWWAQKDDPRIDEVPSWQKDNFLVVGTDKWEDVDPNHPPYPGAYTREVDGKTQVNNGVLFRIPMSQDTAIVSALTRRTLDALSKHDDKAFDNFNKSILAMVDISGTPNMFAPMLEQVTNHSFFTDRPLVPHSLIDGPNKVLPVDRSTPYTSETAKLLGQFISKMPGGKEIGIASPAIIENYVRHWSGTMGQYALQAFDAALIKSGAIEDPNKPAGTWADTPFAKAFFVRFPTSSAESIERMRKDLDAMDMRMNSVKLRIKQGDFASAEQEMAASEAEGKFGRLSGVRQTMAEMQQKITQISNDKTMDKNDKRQLIDGLIYSQIYVARGVNAVLKDINRDLDKK
jgi:hypothetical protein